MKLRKLILAALATALVLEGGAALFGGSVLPPADAAAKPIKNCYSVGTAPSGPNAEMKYVPSIYKLEFGELSIPGQRGCLTTRPNGVQRMRVTVPFNNMPECRPYPGANMHSEMIGKPTLKTTRVSATAVKSEAFCDFQVKVKDVVLPITFSYKITREFFTWSDTGKVFALTQGRTCALNHTNCSEPTVISFTSQ